MKGLFIGTAAAGAAALVLMRVELQAQIDQLRQSVTSECSKNSKHFLDMDSYIKKTLLLKERNITELQEKIQELDRRAQEQFEGWQAKANERVDRALAASTREITARNQSVLDAASEKLRLSEQTLAEAKQRSHRRRSRHNSE
jgi:hypothetical protein